MKKVILFGSGLISVLFATTINIPSDYTTIQAGINASVDGDTVLVAQGTYSENLILEKEIVLASHALNDDLNTEWINNENIQETIISGTSEPVDPDYGSCLVVRDGNIAPTIRKVFEIFCLVLFTINIHIELKKFSFVCPKS